MIFFSISSRRIERRTREAIEKGDPDQIIGTRGLTSQG